ncbi:unnamed protein product [Danaus chrysippus]|uniref:(African queen) hypothetical protein n=1 Tax=Danaus chrysippus TaxID=151541 RepID=A0A8J2QT64_9NEOP|nr:unnamed protein product [Danaus chrysippus]
MGGSNAGPTRVLTPSPFVIGPGLLPGVSLGHGVASGAPAVHRNGYGHRGQNYAEAGLCMMGPGYMPYAGFYGYQPIPFKYSSCLTSEHTVYGYNREESVLSGSGGSSAGSDHLTTKEPPGQSHTHL